MYGLQRWMWATVFAVAAMAPAAAQQPTTPTTTTPSTNGSGSINSGGRTAPSLSSQGGNSLGNRGSNGMSGGNFGANNTLTSDLLSVFQPQNLQYTNLGTSTSSMLQKSNVFSGFYANPYAMGMSSSGGGTGGGGFGQPLYGTSTGGQSAGGRNASFNSSFNSSGGFGAGGFGGGGRGGQNNAANQSGILIPVQVQMNYTALLQFPAAPAAASRIQTDIRAALNGTSMIANAKAVEVITDRNNNVTLRGPVADEDEARLIEGMVRLTPGVREIKNELVPAIRSGGR